MQRLTLIFSILLMSMSLAACEPQETHIIEAPAEPVLTGFYVIDSYGYSSDYSPVYESILNPEINDGLFDIYWYVESFYDYWVTVTISDRPSMAGSILLSEELCGYDHSCDYDGSQLCEYTLDFEMGCGADLYDVHRNMTSIAPLMRDLPEYLYLNIEICDESGWPCQVSSREVTLY